MSGEGERLKKKHKQRFDVTCRVVSLCIQTVHRQRMPGPCHTHRVSGERQQALALLLTVGPGHCLSILNCILTRSPKCPSCLSTEAKMLAREEEGVSHVSNECSTMKWTYCISESKVSH